MQRLRGLFSRYSAAHLVLVGPCGPIIGSQGYPIGHINGVEFRQDRLCVSGQILAGHPTVTLHLGAMQTCATLPADGGAFKLDLPRPVGLSLHAVSGDLVISGAVPFKVTLQSPLPRILRLSGQFIKTVLRLTPDIARWFISHDYRSKALIKAGLGLNRIQTAAGPVADTLFNKGLSKPSTDTGITIILPVYNAPDLLRTCLVRVSEHTDLPWHMIAVDDGSSDPNVRPILRDWVAGRPDGQVTLIERDKNKGFIASVNTAFDIIQGDPRRRDLPVVLLNTDAFVPQGWASRLIAPLQENSDVASVTPMSNDAEIFSVSAICAHQTLRAGMGDAIDAVARTLSPLHATAEAPTGVGFCMAIAPAFLAQKPQFDTVFGKGYGEEVDWCQKTRALNGRHLGIGTLFVEHKGGGSFGTETKHALIARNNKIVSQRYPGFDRKVQDFITVDPLRGPRLALALAWAGTISSNNAVPIYLAHSLGGGAENWLQTQISELTAQGLPAIVLRIGGNTRWQVEVWSSGGVTAGQTDNFGLVERLLKPLNNRRIVYSCGVGDRDPVELPAILMKLRRGSQDRLEVLFHDYFPVSPSFTLLDSSGQYRGVPSLRSPDTAHITLRPDSSIVDLDVWQAAWGGLLHAADTIVTFSTSSAKILFGVWPELRDRIDVRPHSLGALPPHLNTPDRTTLTLGVLGNIAPHKGAATVTALAALSKAERGGSMVLIGNIDPTYSLHRNCTMHGNYTPADIPALVAHYGITHWLIPSIWPETFSYTTHEALATGLPVLAFDIGAQGDAVRRAPNGCPVRYDPDGDTIAPLLTTFTDDHGKTR